MTAFIIIAACLVCLDRMFFKGQLLSIFIDGIKTFADLKRLSPKISRNELAAVSDPSSLIVSKRYANGHKRPVAATGATTKQSVEGDAIFVRQARPELPQMKDWSDLVVQPSISEEGEPVEPEELVITIIGAPTAKTELRDPEVVSLLGTLEAGERIVTDDATQEEMRAIKNFDMRAYV